MAPTLSQDDLNAIAALLNDGVTVRYFHDSEGDVWPIDPPANGATYQLDNREIQAKTDNLPSDPADASVLAGLISDLAELIRRTNTAAEVDANTIKLFVGSTKAKSHLVTGNLTGKTLKLYIVGLTEINATGADGSFTFTPPSELADSIKTHKATLREPSDGNNVLWNGQIEVGFAADEE